jgi:cytochrome P450
MVYTPKEAPEYPKVIAGVQCIFDRCIEEYNKRKTEPQQDNLLSYFAHAEFEGRHLTEEEVLSYCNNIITGGVDTTTALTTHALTYLHDHPEAKQRLIEDREAIPVAREEFLRFYTPIHALARNVSHDVTYGDVEMKAGDPVLLAWAAANRDPEIFENPETVDVARSPNRHIAFGAGRHRCIGSNIARVMFEEMMDQVLNRIPDYRIDYSQAKRYTSVGTINGWINMPISFPPGPKVGTDLEL